MSGGPEMWRVTSEDRQKHDNQFFSLKPVMGFVTGEQARGFFLQSGIPAPVLGQIWSLADMNGDGKMDRKEFSIAMFLIKKKLFGAELPKVLPASLKQDPAPAIGTFGTMPAPTVSSQGVVGGGFGMFGDPAPQSNMTNGVIRSNTMPAHSSGVAGGIDLNRAGSAVDPRSRTSSASGDMSVPHQSKLRYNQLFNTHDRFRRNYLTGVEARAILQQTGLPQPVLAQIWTLSDIDMDGKLTQDEFILAMHLSDLAKSGQTLPAKLPPELIPQSMKRDRSGSGALAPSIGAPAEVPQLAAPIMASTVTFEDKRKLNFDKGHAELEKRRQMLRDMQMKEEEARMAKERAEQEKREKIRMEQERKKQQQLEKQMQKQREIEREKEEQRRKAMEAREAARREMERQRQLEWERQRREQLLSEKKREQEILATLKSQVSNLKYELEALDNKKSEIALKISLARNSITDHTSAIDKMRETRDAKLAEIETIQRQGSDVNQKLTFLTKDKEKLDLTQQTSLQSNPLVDTYKTVQHSHHSKKIMIEKLRSRLKEVENELAGELREVDNNNSELKVLRVQGSSLESDNQQVQQQIIRKQQEWAERKRKREQERKDQDRSDREKQDRVRQELEQQRIREENRRQQREIDEQRQREAEIQRQREERKRREEEERRKTEEEQRRKEQEKSKKEEDLFKGFDQQPASSAANDIWGEAFSNHNQQPQISKDVWGDAFGSNKEISQKESPAFSSNTQAFASKATASPKKDGCYYKGVYQFDARNHDELSLTPGDTVFVPKDQTGAEPGWMVGEIANKRGFFPEAYVEKIPDDQQPMPVAKNVVNYENNEIKEEPKAAFELNQSVDSSFMPVKSVPTIPAVSPTPGQGECAPDGLQAQALYPWRAKKDNHLTFNKGDLITVKEQQDIWWSGELNGKIGWFPKSYVKLVNAATSQPETTPAVADKPTFSSIPNLTDSARSSPSVDSQEQQGEYYVAIYKYLSAEPGDLSFNQGDIITVTKAEGEWWTGTFGEKTGMFPANYVKRMETQPGQKISGGKKPEIASVIAPYEATGQEQLSLQPGQLIQIRKKSPSGWWEGELQARGQKKKIGWFPANYVKLLGGGSGGGGSARDTPNESLTPQGTPTHEPKTAPSHSAQTVELTAEQVIAIYPYTAQNHDELSFQKGSVIMVVSKDDADWWKGELNGATGVFPSTYVQPLSEARPDTPSMSAWESDPDVLAATSPTEVKRQQHLHELINSEESYMADMSIVLDVFYRPLSASKVLTEQELQSIFVNWKELIICNTKLLKSMRVRKKMSGQGQVIHIVGDILCENLPHLTPYIRFCSCQLNAGALIQHMFETSAQFREVCQKCCQDSRTKGMPLSSFLLKPMQRITKYPLLIQKIMEYTPPEHPDHQNLQDALEAAQLLCSQVNEGVREKENSDRLEWIQNHVNCEGLPEKITFNSVTNSMGPRKFLFSGTLSKAKSNKELVGFLFNDFLLLVQPLGSAIQKFSFDPKGTATYKMYKQPLFLNEVVVKPSTDEQEPTTFHINIIDKMFSLKAVTTNERDNWVKKINEAIKASLDNDRKKRERAYSIRKTPGVGRLLVVILEGINLQASDINGKSDPYCEVSMGSQEHKTKVINTTLNPKWNSSMQFTIKDVQQDVLCITVYDRDLFTPNDFLGRTEIRIADILAESRDKKGPISKRLQLLEVDHGEVIVKLDLQLYQNN